MPTREQIITIQTAKRWLIANRAFTDMAYRTLLRSVGLVESSTKLTNDDFEKVMAVMEAMGFDQHPRGTHYWRDKAVGKGGRAVWKIHALAAEPAAKRYSLSALCLRFSHDRTDVPEQLNGQESYALIEMLKAVVGREAHKQKLDRALGRQPDANLFGEAPPPPIATPRKPLPPPSEIEREIQEGVDDVIPF